MADELIIERRYYQTEVRLNKQADASKIIGYGAVFNSLSEDLGGFQEMIMPGAFAGVMDDPAIMSLFNHNFDLILGRRGAGTLTVSQDDLGLRYEVNVPDTSYARDLVVSLERGDINQSSFGFTVEKDEWDVQRILPLRKIVAIKRLFDLGPVSLAAYPATSAATRDYLSNLLSRAAQSEAVTNPARRLDLLRRKLEIVSRQ